MRNHIYVHTSKFDYIEHIRDDNLFERPYNLPLTEINKSHKFEYGRIKTNENYIHFIVGNIPQENCPWCGGMAVLKKLPRNTDNEFVDISCFSKYYLYSFQCITCGSRGPCVRKQISEVDEIFFDEFKQMMEQRYKLRRSWDKDFVNPYSLGE